MQGRISTLIKHINDHVGLVWAEDDKEELANLIIQECLLSLEPDLYTSDIDYDVEQKFYQRSARKIQQHFGVEK